MLGSQIIWNGVPFGAISAKGLFLPVQDFRVASAVKVEADKETGMSKTTGRELQEACLTIRAQKIMGSEPRATFEALSAMRGMSGGIFITNSTGVSATTAILDKLQTSDWRRIFSLGTAKEVAKSLLLGTSAGDVKFMLTAVEMDAQGITASGVIYDALITLSFTEDAGQRQGGGLIVYYNDKDITADISVHACTYEMHADGQADCLDIDFADTKKQWSNWKPGDNKDTIRLTDGAADTGKMYIDSLKPENGNYRLTAYSTPKSAFSVKSRSFSDLSLLQLAGKIAEEHGLEARSYSAPETRVAYVQQRGQNDLAFLNAQCRRAGAAFVIFDGAICLYSQKDMEGRDAVRTLEPDATDDFTVSDDLQGAYSRCELSNGTHVGTATDSSVTSGKVYRESVTAAWTSVADANAAASAKLRELNRGTRTAELTTSTMRGLAAGSVVRLVCKGWLGNAFIFRIRHDLAAKKSHIWLRKPLNY